MEVHWWIGVVESKNDPEARGRVQVRVLGIHTNETFKQEKKGIGIPMDDLPWAVCMMPLTYGGIAESTVAPPAVMPGAWVIGISLDGDAYQKLMVLGVISMALSPLATHTGEDLGAAQKQPIKEEDIKETDTCAQSFSKALKNLTARGDNKLKANYMMMVLQYIKKYEPQKYQNFVKTSGLEISDNTVIAQGTSNDMVNQLLAEGYYNYCLDTCEDPVLAALSYKVGLGKAIKGFNGEESYIQKYGDPRNKDVSYEDLASRIEQEDPEGAKFMRDFIQELGESCMNRCVYGLGNSSPNNNTSSTTAEGVTSSTNTTVDGLKVVVLPTDSNVITSLYMSSNRPEYGSKEHRGLDLRAPSGAPIRAMSEGTVTALYPRWGGVLIDHGFGIKTRYLHLRKVYVKIGTFVKAGEQIGESGNAGLPQCSPHLHFEVWKNNTKIDPEAFLKENGIITSRKKGA
jgi:murein DD-endopeptidase MepM/ murein hydrolase activator NlpD